MPLLLFAGCTAERAVEVGLPLNVEDDLLSTRLDEIGPQGFTAGELLSAAVEQFGDFPLTWSDTPEVRPASDELWIAFSEPVFELRRVSAPWSEESRDYLRVGVTVDVVNPAGTLQVLDAPMSLVSPDLSTYGAVLFGEAPLVAGGEYFENLMEDNVTGEMTLGFESSVATAWLTLGVLPASPMQALGLVRWFQDERSSGTAVTYGCGASQPCRPAE